MFQPALPSLNFFNDLSFPFSEVSISSIFVLVSCCKSGMASEGRLSAVFKSCTRILAKRERNGSCRVKTEFPEFSQKKVFQPTGPSGLTRLKIFNDLSFPFSEVSISSIFVLVSCCKSGMVSEGRLPADFISCTRILAISERKTALFESKLN